MGDEWGKKAFIAGLGGVLVWKSLRPETRRQILNALDQAAAMALQPPQPQMNIASPPPVLPAPRAPLILLSPTALGKPTKQPVPRLLPNDFMQGLLSLRETQGSFSKPPEPTPIVIDTDSRWRSVIKHPSVVLILGKRGSGKSALGYRLLELFRNRLSPYAVGIPQAAAKTLPDWIGVAGSLEHVPQNSIALLDEAHLAYHSRNSFKQRSTGISRLLNLSRQREQTVVFISQEARQIDVNIASSANVLVFKEPSMLQFEFERRELKLIAQRATDSFTPLTKTQRKKTGYVHAPDADFQGVLESELPSFWSDRLSKAFAAESAAVPARKPVRPSREEKQKKAIELSRAGWSLSKIAAEVGVSKSTVVNYLKGYPYN